MLKYDDDIVEKAERHDKKHSKANPPKPSGSIKRIPFMYVAIIAVVVGLTVQHNNLPIYVSYQMHHVGKILSHL